jgi:flavin reductase (DIM6/NTAB) family NADH-FMN oxidoreductase RutF
MLKLQGGKRMKKAITPEPYFPAMPVVIVATKDGERLNFAPHGMYGLLSYEPALIYISVVKVHKTAEIIEKTKKFSVNIPGAQLLEKIERCGNVSGAEVDKSREFEVFYGEHDVPLIKECPVNLSCEVYNTIDTKDMVIYKGRVVEMFADEACLEDGRPVAEKINPVLCTSQGTFHGMGDSIK